MEKKFNHYLPFQRESQIYFAKTDRLQKYICLINITAKPEGSIYPYKWFKINKRFSSLKTW